MAKIGQAVKGSRWKNYPKSHAGLNERNLQKRSIGSLSWSTDGISESSEGIQALGI